MYIAYVNSNHKVKKQHILSFQHRTIHQITTKLK